jgi:hypothetical protein
MRCVNAGWRSAASNLPRRRPGKNSRKHRAAQNTGVVLFYSRILRRADAVKREVSRKQTSAEIIGDSPGGVHPLTIRTG